MFDRFAGGGLKFGGWVPGRPEDEFGIAFAAAFPSDSWRRATAAGPAEIAVEASYRAQIAPWLSVQPSAHYIRNPAADPALADAFVLGLRFQAPHSRSEEHTSELQSPMRISYAVLCVQKKHT